jgi:hypothetical protein
MRVFCTCVEMHAVSSLHHVAKAGTMSVDLANILPAKRKRGVNEGTAPTASVAQGTSKQAPAKAAKVSRVKNASSSGRKAAGTRKASPKPPPRIQASRKPPPRMQAPGNLGIPDVAAAFIRLVRYKLSSRNAQVPLPSELLQIGHYEEGMKLGPFDGDTTEKMAGYLKTFKHHVKYDEPIGDDILALVCDTLGAFAANCVRVAGSDKEGGQGGTGTTLGTHADLPPDDREKVRRQVHEAVVAGTSQQQSVDRDVSFVTHAGVEGTKAFVLADYGRLWAKGHMCHARFVVLFHSSDLSATTNMRFRNSRYSSDREVYSSFIRQLPSSPPIVKCLLHVCVASPLRLRS